MVEANFRVSTIQRTYYRGHEYEAGASFYIVRFQDMKGEEILGTSNIFYPISYLQKELNNGYELYLKLSRFGGLDDSEFDIRKIS